MKRYVLHIRKVIVTTGTHANLDTTCPPVWTIVQGCLANHRSKRSATSGGMVHVIVALRANTYIKWMSETLRWTRVGECAMIGRRVGATRAETASLNIALLSEHHNQDIDIQERPYSRNKRINPQVCKYNWMLNLSLILNTRAINVTGGQ